MAAGGHATIRGLIIEKEPEEKERIRTHTEQVQEHVRSPSGTQSRTKTGKSSHRGKTQTKGIKDIREKR